MLHCNGHCFLMKALKKEADQEKNLGDAFSKMEIMICQNNFPLAIPNTHYALVLKEKIRPTNTPLWQLYTIHRLTKPPAA